MNSKTFFAAAAAVLGGSALVVALNQNPADDSISEENVSQADKIELEACTRDGVTATLEGRATGSINLGITRNPGKTASMPLKQVVEQIFTGFAGELDASELKGPKAALEFASLIEGLQDQGTVSTDASVQLDPFRISNKECVPDLGNAPEKKWPQTYSM